MICEVASCYGRAWGGRTCPAAFVLDLRRVLFPLPNCVVRNPLYRCFKNGERTPERLQLAADEAARSGDLQTTIEYANGTRHTIQLWNEFRIGGIQVTEGGGGGWGGGGRDEGGSGVFFAAFYTLPPCGVCRSV